MMKTNRLLALLKCPDSGRVVLGRSLGGDLRARRRLQLLLRYERVRDCVVEGGVGGCSSCQGRERRERRRELLVARGMLMHRRRRRGRGGGRPCI